MNTYINIEYHPEAITFDSACEITIYRHDGERGRYIKIVGDFQQGWNYVQYERITSYIWDEDEPDEPGYMHEQLNKTVLTDVSDWHWVAFEADF